MPNSQQSSYKQIANDILNRIHDGSYPKASYLPSEHKLAEEYGVTRVTVRKALNILKNKGSIESFQGKGYQIKALHWEQSLLQFYSFGKNIAREIDNTKTKVLSYEKLSEFPLKKEFNKSIILEENIFTESELWKINRLRLVNNVPLILETSYIPMNYLPKFKTEELKQKSLYTLLENNHITIVKAREDLKATLANIEEQKLLKIDDNNPLFKTIRYTYDSKESIVEIRKSLIRADYFNFTVEISI